MKKIKITQKNVSNRVQQFSLDNLTTSRAYINGKGWKNIDIDGDFFDWSVNQIVDLLGGRETTKNAVRFALRNTPINGWFARRIVFNEMRNTWEYIAGQDYPAEIRAIKKQIIIK